jgi:hypothetical protein
LGFGSFGRHITGKATFGINLEEAMLRKIGFIVGPLHVLPA